MTIEGGRGGVEAITSVPSQTSLRLPYWTQNMIMKTIWGITVQPAVAAVGLHVGSGSRSSGNGR